MSYPSPPWTPGPPGQTGDPGSLVRGTTVVQSDTWFANVPTLPDVGVLLDQGKHLFPWTDADVEDEPFGRAQGIVLPVGFGAHVNVEPEPYVAPNLWYLRIYKLDQDGSITGSVDVPTEMSGFAAISTMTGPYTARIICSEMTNLANRSNEVIDVDFAGIAPVVTAHSANAPNGPGLSSYSAGIGAHYFPGADITCYTYYAFGVMKGSNFLSETAPYPSGYQIWGPPDTLGIGPLATGDVVAFPYVAFLSYDYNTLTASIVVGETRVTEIGTVEHVPLHFCTVPMTNGDIYWIRPVALVGTVLTVLERVMQGEGNYEIGWQVNTYEMTTGARIATIAEVLEPTDKPQYLATTPDVQFNTSGAFMVFADKGPDWGTFADWGAGTLHPGFEREVLYYSTSAQDLSSVIVPRPTQDGHGEMDSLSSRSTGGSFTGNRWAMVSAMTDLYEDGHYYAADFWSGAVGQVGGELFKRIYFRDWTARPYIADGSPYPAIHPGTPDPVEAGWYQIRWQLHMVWIGSHPDLVRFDQRTFHDRGLLPISHGVGLTADRVVFSPDSNHLDATFTTTVFYTPGAANVGYAVGTGIDPEVYYPFSQGYELDSARLVGEITAFSPIEATIPV